MVLPSVNVFKQLFKRTGRKKLNQVNYENVQSLYNM